MRAMGKRSVLCFAAMALAVASGLASSACAAQKAEKTAKAGAEKATMSFRVKPEASAPLDLSTSSTGFSAPDLDGPEAELTGGFALSPAAVAGDAALLGADRYYASAGPVTWRSNAFSRQAQAGGPIDSVRVSLAGSVPTAAMAPLSLQRPEAYEVREVDVTVVRGWPRPRPWPWPAVATPWTSPPTPVWASAGPAARPRPGRPFVWARRRTWATR